MSTQYEINIQKELALWEKDILSSSGFLEKLSRRVQKKVDSLIPEKIHKTMAGALEMAVNSVLTGIKLIPVNTEKLEKAKGQSLAQQDREADRIISTYRKIGAAGGAGTGSGGIMMMALDYPALISLKLKMLQELAQAYGHNIREQEERLFLLKVYFLAFSGDMARIKVYREIKNWSPENKCGDGGDFGDWREFYSEYKESIEFKKMLQIVPGLGAVVGAWANYSFIDELGRNAKNSYRLRYLKSKEPVDSCRKSEL